MKKYIFSVISILLLTLFSSPVFAAVNLSATDTSTSTTKQIGIAIDTETDTLTSLSVSIQASSDVTITNVSQGTADCGTFSSTNKDNVVTISCAMTTPIAISGNVANITFTSTSSAYKFTILQDSTLDIGQLTLGTVTNVDASTVSATAQTSTTTATTSTTKTTSTTTSSTLKDKIMSYLPYVLIGGAVILLISIVGILLSKKKDTKETSENVTLPKDEPTPVDAPVENTTPINMDNISNNLYTPSVATPSIQETLQESTPSPIDNILNQDQPAFEPTPVKIPENEQSSDLQALLHQESQSDSGPATPLSTETPSTPTQASTNLESIMPEVTPNMPATNSDVVPPVDTVPAMGADSSTEESVANPWQQASVPEINSEVVPSVDTIPGTETSAPDLNMNLGNTMNAADTTVEEPKPIDTTPAQEISSTPIPDLQQFINSQVSQVPPVATETTPMANPTEATIAPNNPAPAVNNPPVTQFGV